MDNQSMEFDMSKPFDATVKVFVSDDGQQATLSIEQPENGGSVATPQMIDQALKNANVVYGLDTGLLAQLKNKPVYSQEYVIARGLRPVNGKDGSMVFHFRLVTEPHPKLLEDGTVDYHNLGMIENTRQGKVLCEIIPPTPGSEGMSVTGKKLLQIQGKPVNPPVGRNVKLSDDRTKITASVDGHVTFVNSKINVIQTFVVNENVDNSTGDIVFVGNVEIYGSVLENFKVEAAGNVEIYGTIQGGNVKAGKNLNVHGGIVGMNRSEIKCGDNMVSTFIENATVDVNGSMTAESIMNCTVKCGGNLELVGIRAKLVGGRCIVCRNITANTIGSPANLPTELTLGADPATVTRHAALLREIERMTTQGGKLGQIVTLLTQYEAAGRLPADKAELLANSRLSLSVNATKLRIKQKELELIKQKIEGAGKGEVVCRGTMFRGVRLTIGIAHKDIEENVQCSSFTCKEGEIVISHIY